MSLLHQNTWSGKNVPKWVVILRVVLGGSLIYKGIDFIQNKDQLISFFGDDSSLKNFDWVVGVLPWVHIIGGILILLGFFTKLMSLIQIPILLGAVVFVNLQDSAFKGAQSELPLSFLMLVLVIVFFVEGGGFMSLDNYLRKPLNEGDEMPELSDD